MHNLPEKIQLMKEGGRLLSLLMVKTLALIEVGTTGQELESYFDSQIKALGVQSAFKGYEGYPYHLCIGINDMVVHGFPSARRFQNGDIVTMDMGLIYKNYYADMARTVIIGQDIHWYQPFVEAVKAAHFAAVAQAKVGNKIGDMSAASQKIVEFDNPYGVVREMVGHGVGEKLHMSPDVPGYGRVNSGPVLKEFQTLAVEIIAVRHPNSALKTSADGWQTTSVTGEVSAIYENSIYVGKNGGVLLTS